MSRDDVTKIVPDFFSDQSGLEIGFNNLIVLFFYCHIKLPLQPT